MRVNYIVSYSSRRVFPENNNVVVAVRQDHKSDVIRFVFDPAEFAEVGIDISNASIKVLYKEPEGDTKVGATTGHTLPANKYAADWAITSDVTDQANSVTFSLVVKMIDGQDVDAAWYSVPQTFKIYDTITDVDGPYEVDEDEEATASEQILALQNAVTTLQQANSLMSDTIEALTERLSAAERDLGYTMAIESLPAVSGT